MMSKHRKFVLLILVISFFIVISAGRLLAEPVKIKGFFIGMNIDDALRNFERLGFEGLTVRERTHKEQTFYAIQPGSGDRFLVETDMNAKTVDKIVFSGGIANRLFHTHGIGAEIFQKSFADAYDILGMKVFKDNPGQDAIKGWEHYNLKDGYRIRIFLNKDVEIIKISKASEFAFD
jgi:hypothetical protein